MAVGGIRERGASGTLYYRHSVPVRIMHWINVVALTVLLMSGLNIFNAHPTLNWGKSSYDGTPAVLEIAAIEGPGGAPIGVTRVFGHQFVTTGVLGVSRDRGGELTVRAFPWWLTIPDNQWLAMARRWHLFFAWIFVINGLCYVAYSALSRHLARDLAPTSADLGSIGQSIVDHLKFKHPTGEAAKRYNVLQKLSLSRGDLRSAAADHHCRAWRCRRGSNSLWPGWIDLLGGRQSARTIHFVVAWLLVAFVLVHVFEVIISGFWNHLRSMITGRYRIVTEKAHEATH